MTDSRPVSPEGPAPLPCPFCDGRPSVRHYKDGSAGIACSEQGCAACILAASSYKEALARWNRRPSRSAGSPETQERIVVTIGDVDRALRMFGLDVAHDHPDREAMTRVLRQFLGEFISRPSPGEAGAPPFNELEHFALRLDAIAESAVSATGAMQKFFSRSPKKLS